MTNVVTLLCPSCGGKLRATEDPERFICTYCATEHIVKQNKEPENFHKKGEDDSQDTMIINSQRRLMGLEKKLIAVKMAKRKRTIVGTAIGFAGGVAIIFILANGSRGSLWTSAGEQCFTLLAFLCILIGIGLVGAELQETEEEKNIALMRQEIGSQVEQYMKTGAGRDRE